MSYQGNGGVCAADHLMPFSSRLLCFVACHWWKPVAEPGVTKDCAEPSQSRLVAYKLRRVNQSPTLSNAGGNGIADVGLRGKLGWDNVPKVGIVLPVLQPDLKGM